MKFILSGEMEEVAEALDGDGRILVKPCGAS